MRILTLASLRLLPVLLAATVLCAYAEPCPDGTKPPCSNRVVVLPFTAVDPADTAIADRLSAEVARSLAAVQGIDVKLLARGVPAPDDGYRSFAAAYNARYMVDGLVKRSGEKVRFTAQTVDMKHDTIVHADVYEGSPDALADLGARIARDTAKLAGPQTEPSFAERSGGGFRWTSMSTVVLVYLVLLATTVVLVFMKKTHWGSIVGVAIMPIYFLWVLWDLTQSTPPAEKKA